MLSTTLRRRSDELLVTDVEGAVIDEYAAKDKPPPRIWRVTHVLAYILGFLLVDYFCGVWQFQAHPVYDVDPDIVGRF